MNESESQKKLMEAILAEDARLPENGVDQALLDSIASRIDTPDNIIKVPFWKNPFFTSSAAACAVIGLFLLGMSAIKGPDKKQETLTSAPTKQTNFGTFEVDLQEADLIASKEQKPTPPILLEPRIELADIASAEFLEEVLPAPTLDSRDFRAQSESKRTEVAKQSVIQTKQKVATNTAQYSDTNFSSSSSNESVSFFGTPNRRQQLAESHYGRGESGVKYAQLNDQSFQSPLKEPLSTFSIDTDRASYTNLRSNINRGVEINPDSVRIEELVNAFNYDYEQPKGKHPFAVHVETANCPWNAENRLVKIGLKGKEINQDARPATNLVLLCDVSGSMNSTNKLGYLKASFMELVENLDERDTVSIVTYAGSEGVALQPTKATSENQQTIFRAIETLKPGGGTNGEAGINLAYKLANENFVTDGVNRVILATDGDFNVGVTGDDALVSVVKSGARKGTFLTVLGFGHDNLNDSMLEKITNDGNGQYFFIDSRQEGSRVFGKELTGTLMTIAKDVKIQVEFNPREVQEYRLIGYSNRMLEAEDFNNDRIDAGEIGAGHTVTALYEVVPGRAIPEVDDLKYVSPPLVKPGQKVKKFKPLAQKAPEVLAELLTVKLRYKQPQGRKSKLLKQAVVDTETSFENASEDFQFASSVALFGMLLRDSEYLGAADPELVEQIAAETTKEQSEREEFIKLVQKWRGEQQPLQLDE